MIDDAFLHAVATELTTVPGVVAVALGGSRARGSHTPDSDFDLGLYYDPSGLDLAALRSLAAKVNEGPVEVTGPGGWGPWVDGGGWLTTRGDRLDWILRSVPRVQDQVARALAGEFAFHVQPGHPLGFLDVSYAGEVALGRPLADPAGLLAELRDALDPYPDRLRAAMVANLWQSDFLLSSAAKAAGRGDVAYVALCCASAALFCAHAWHAVAGVWVVNEKDLLPGVGRLPLDCGPFVRLAQDALECLDQTAGGPAVAIERMRQAVGITRERLA